MAHLSRWLVDRGLDEHALTSSVVKEFLRARRVTGYRQWLSARGMAPLLDHLRDVGIASVCSPAMADSVVEVLLAGYRAYLIEERGLAASTVRNYVDVARQFVSQYCASGRTDLCGLTAAQVSEFVLAGCRTRGVGSAAILVVGMRALLRYLHLTGVPASVRSPSVPRVSSVSTRASVAMSQFARFPVLNRLSTTGRSYCSAPSRPRCGRGCSATKTDSTRYAIRGRRR